MREGSPRFRRWLEHVYRRFPPLTAGQEAEYVARAQSGDLEARDVLLCSNMGLLARMASGYAERSESFWEEGDFVGEAVLGLCECLPQFAPDRKVRFMSYGSYWVRQRMGRFAVDNQSPVRLPANKRIALRRMKKAVDRESRITYLSPEMAELPPEDDFDLSDYDEGALFGFGVVHTNQHEWDRDDSELPDSMCQRSETRAILRAHMEVLRERDRLVLTRRFGLDDHKPCELEVIGRELGLSRERVRLLANRAVERLGKSVGLNGPPCEDLEPWPVEDRPALARTPYASPGGCLPAAERLRFLPATWWHECACCGEWVATCSPWRFECPECGYDTAAMRECRYCGDRVPIGFPCYCDYAVERRSRASIVARALAPVGSASIDELILLAQDAAPYLDAQAIRQVVYSSRRFVVTEERMVALAGQVPDDFRRRMQFSSELEELEAEAQSAAQEFETEVRGLQQQLRNLVRTRSADSSEAATIRQAIADARDKYVGTDRIYLERKEELLRRYSEAGPVPTAEREEPQTTRSEEHEGEQLSLDL